MEAERTHHDYSPSTLQSLEACPGFKSRDSNHVRTIIGTISHKVTETREDDNRLDDEDAASAAECLDFYDARRAAALDYRFAAVKAQAAKYARTNEALTEKHLSPADIDIPKIIEHQEIYLPVDDLVFPDGVKHTTAGYVDRALIAHNREYAELFDWKFGMWPVESAENNLQGMAYTLGLFKMYPTLKTVRFWFKQPNTGQITQALFTRAQFAEIYLRIQVVVARAREARALIAKGDWSKTNPMVPVCNFCDNIGKCEKVLAIACKVGRKFYPLEMPEDICPNKVMDRHNTSLAMRLSAVLAVWAKAFRSQTTDRVIRRDAEMPDGFTMTSRADRVVKDPAKLREISLQYISAEEYDALLSKEPAFGALEEAIKDKAVRGQKTATLDKFKEQTTAAGAVDRGEPYTFLKAVADKKD